MNNTAKKRLAIELGKDLLIQLLCCTAVLLAMRGQLFASARLFGGQDTRQTGTVEPVSGIQADAACPLRIAVSLPSTEESSPGWGCSMIPPPVRPCSSSWPPPWPRPCPPQARRSRSPASSGSRPCPPPPGWCWTFKAPCPCPYWSTGWPGRMPDSPPRPGGWPCMSRGTVWPCAGGTRPPGPISTPAPRALMPGPSPMPSARLPQMARSSPLKTRTMTVWTRTP